MTTRLIRLLGAALAIVAAACGGDAGDTTAAPSAPSTSGATTTIGGSTATPAPTTTALDTTAPSSTASTSTLSPSTSIPDADHVIDVTVAAGVVTAPDRPEVAVGATVLLRVTSDVADEAHVHGYDYYVDLVSGGTAELEFVADIPGIFEVELEGAGTLLVELVVR